MSNERSRDQLENMVLLLEDAREELREWMATLTPEEMVKVETKIREIKDSYERKS